ncbi:MAG: flagellar biosynthetic protein FliO [Proteobacteria bacterium]|nr:flagellar biosynthetic protein FliO [Pseudomonadota bacterium]MBU1640934.1 flagellar biosynthetic protein FliO [Pseudomonadota bacterium]
MPLSAWAADELPLAVVTPQFAPMESMAAIGKLLAAFLVIGALMALLFKGIKKMGLGNGSMSKGGLISVLDTRLIAPKKYIAVVRVAGENLAIGISDNSFSLLCKLGPDTVPQDISSGNSTFNDTLCKANLAHNEEAPHA